MHITIFSLFPQYFSSPLSQSLLGKALDSGVLSIEIVDIRTFATDPHRMADDRPFGGGAGMVMKVEPIERAVADWKHRILANNPAANITTLLLSASGEPCTQQKARALAAEEYLGLVCGHYEGVDERVVSLGIVDGEVRVGDLVLSGGEPAAAVIIDAIARLQPGFLGNAESLQGESHDTEGVGGYPVYTRPSEFQGEKVPEVLLSGDHAAIAQWREEHRKKLTPA